jgi:RNA polymerase sigma-70 factor (ECF subfamily)
MAVAAKLMRRILIDHARARLCPKRGGGHASNSWDQALATEMNSQEQLLAINEALEKLHILDPRQEEIVEMRFFGGLSVAETAEVLGISVRTVEREWTVARAWLYRQLMEEAPR